MVITPELPLTGPEGEFQAEPVAILERKIKKKGDAYTVFIKVSWAHLPESEATWEDYYEMEKRYPEFMAHQTP